MAIGYEIEFGENGEEIKKRPISVREFFGNDVLAMVRSGHIDEALETADEILNGGEDAERKSEAAAERRFGITGVSDEELGLESEPEGDD